ncbi:MAG: sulfotransferase family protein, partial [Thermodesulfobacteriota bacterium]
MTMPNFLIIGAAKSGTTSLYHYLKQHPQIYMSPIKEPRFFAFDGMKVDFCGPRDENLNRGTITEIETYRALFQAVSNELAIGEASPIYIYNSRAPGRIKHYIPNVKLIAILRNPAERAYSSFTGLIRDGREPLTDFAEALRQEETRASNNWSFFWHYKKRGFYYIQLKRYFDLFNREQIKIYLYEDFRDNSLGILKDIFRFLDVDDTFVPDVSLKHNVSGIPRNRAIHIFLAKPNSIKSILERIIPERLRWRMRLGLIHRNLIKTPLRSDVRKHLVQDYRED